MTDTQQNIIQIAREIARDLHEGKEFGKNSNMYEQIHSLVEVLDQNTVLESAEKDKLLAAAWLSKSIEPSKLEAGKKELTFEQIADIAGTDVAMIVDELCAQEKAEKNREKTYKKAQLDAGILEDKLQKESKDNVWLNKAIDAKTLTHASREILMAEKQTNFINDADTSKTKKGYAWHIEYYTTRMLMIEALKDTNPTLYKDLRDLAVKGISAHVQHAVQTEGKKILDVCTEVVKNRADIELNNEMGALMETRGTLIADTYKHAKEHLEEKSVQSQAPKMPEEPNESIPAAPLPKEMPSYKRRVIIDLKTGKQQILNQRYKSR